MLRIVIRQKGQDPREFEHAAGPLIFGRTAGTGTTPHCRIADRYVSKEHMRLTEVAPGRVLLENLSATNPLKIGEDTLRVAEHVERSLPLTVTLGETEVDLHSEGQDRTLVEGEEDMTQPSASHAGAGAMLKTIQRTVYMGNLALTDSEPFLLMRGDLSPERLLTWFETVVAVQRAAAGSPEFFSEAARALVDLVGLDRGLVLLRQSDDWEMMSQHGKPANSDPPFSRGLLRSVLLHKKTTYRSVDETTGSDLNEEAVAAPILNTAEEVVGALYGVRDLRGRKAGSRGVGPIEAQVVQLLAAVVGTGLARQQQEAEASRSRVQFEQFFTPELATHLQNNPRLLEPQDRELTVLFADMRAFSHLSETLGPQLVYALTNDLLERITGCVREHTGVVVDYTGDGLFAMWNAPADQPDHAARACRAALDMLVELEEANQAWRERLGGAEIGLGIGLNTGRALVGNTGTRYKFKYGPRGHIVNVGSRTEAATRQLGMRILMTKATHTALAGQFATRRITKVRVPSIDEPLDLYELHAEKSTPAWLACRETYEAALSLFEDKRFAEACRRIHPLLADPETQEDIPTLTLVARAVECLKNPPQEFDPAIRIGKG